MNFIQNIRVSVTRRVKETSKKKVDDKCRYILYVKCLCKL